MIIRFLQFSQSFRPFACLLIKNRLIVVTAILSQRQFVINLINLFSLALLSNSLKGRLLKFNHIYKGSLPFLYHQQLRLRKLRKGTESN